MLHDNGIQCGKLARAAVNAAEPSELRIITLPWTGAYHHIFDWCQYNYTRVGHLFKALRVPTEQDVAYLHHTSGTSTGLPKPIPQTHRAGVGVLPCLTNGRSKATFTTTPLYHGGIADCFRAWTSSAMIWLFPESAVPITAENILNSLDCAKEATRNSLIMNTPVPPVRYFSSVPYVLEMLANDAKGLSMLQSMDIVGVGGAALPETTGNNLVHKRVNLISRFGSAECGFLLSSHRDYARDKAWQYLRTDIGCEALEFEVNGDGLAELIIRPSWPHMAKRNREDGSYATADLFVGHPKIPHAWKYHSRADSQLTLVTGKKFDPAPLEAAIATSPILSDVLIFGNGEQYPGALLFRSDEARDMIESDVLEQLWPTIDKLNQEGQGHTRLSKKMLVIMPSDAQGLEKSSKGTILRGRAEEIYRNQITAAYNKQIELEIDENSSAWIEDEAIGHFVEQIIEKVLEIDTTRERIPEEMDLFEYGADSVACMQIRAILQRKIMPLESPPLPLNIVYDCRNIKGLSHYLQNLRHGRTIIREDELDLMGQLVKEHGDFSEYKQRAPCSHCKKYHSSISSGNKVVLLTGATGCLGAHILSQLRTDPSIAKIICLVRATNEVAACRRVQKSLLQRRRHGLDRGDEKVEICVGKAGAPNLGLGDGTSYGFVQDKVTHIIHAAWAVNFSTRLLSFVSEHIIGLHNLLKFAISSPRKVPPSFIFCSSTASVLGSGSWTEPIPESISTDPSASSPLGYSRSKWVAEAICALANIETRMNGRISVLRIGQLCGDMQSGVWNVTEAWPLMLSTVKVTGSLPALEDEKLSWLPVDIAAQAVLEITFKQGSGTTDAAPEAEIPMIESLQRNEHDNNIDTAAAQETPVFHLVNPHHTPTWLDLLSWLQDTLKFKSSSSGLPPFDIVPPSKWIHQLESLKGDASKHPARKLLELWKGAYGEDGKGEEDVASEKDNRDGCDKGKGEVTFEMQRTKQVAPVMRNVKPIGEEELGKLWGWIEREMIAKDIDGVGDNDKKIGAEYSGV
ncbi:MAG: hypothetical protein MMC33_006348 [Icmadophila ericetorum]|nr:hypothetical protein [Icmadophila ericetorum]